MRPSRFQRKDPLEPEVGTSKANLLQRWKEIRDKEADLSREKSFLEREIRSLPKDGVSDFELVTWFTKQTCHVCLRPTRTTIHRGQILDALGHEAYPSVNICSRCVRMMYKKVPKSR